MQSQNRGWLILALFFCSGATALVYEVVWSKFLSQMFGSTVYAQTVVLATFMGGLALGNRIFGSWADRLRQPVAAYGCMEILIGIYALCFPVLDQLADYIFVSIGTHIVERAGLLLALKGTLSVVLLIGPTTLMGGTLPLLAAWLQKFFSDAGRRSVRFYSVNSLGAVAGSTLAGFWLVQHFGMVVTLQIAAVTNIIVGAIAIALNRTVWSETPVNDGAAATQPAAQVPVSPETMRWAGLIVALTGAVSMGLEVLSSRSLALIFGSSLQSFAVVLIAFILGIGLGSAWIASPHRSGKAGEKLVVLLLCVAAAWVTVLVFNIERWVDFYRITRTGLGRTEVGYVYHLLLTTGIALVILGFPAACIGAVLPLMIRSAFSEGTPLGAKVGALLTWNTLGAVMGVLVTGFVLMPQLGLRSAFGVLALVLAVLALMVAWRRTMRWGMGGALTTSALAISLFFFGDEGWRQVMSSGIFRVRETKFDPTQMPIRKLHTKIRFYEDAADATVSVEQDDGVVAPASLFLRINGKADAGTELDLSTQLLAAHIPMMAKPDAKDVFVLGLGSGITAGALLAYPLDQIVVAENCEPVIRAARIFGDWNNHVLDNPRTKTWCEDARTVLKLRPQLYDIIITEPSNPWAVGCGSVFSREYYEIAASRLKTGGLVAQWFHIYEMSDEVLRLVLRTFKSVFPFMEVWDTNSGDLLMLGSLQPWPTGADVFRKGFSIDRVRTDLMMIDIRSPEALLARQLASQRTGFAIADDGRIQSDRFPVLEYIAPQAFYIGNTSKLLDRYDERTFQQLLGPAEKRAELGSLPMANVQVLFSTFWTVNGDLYGRVFSNPASANVPCVFQTPTPATPPASDGSIYSEIARAFDAGDLPRATQLGAYALQQNPNDDQARYLVRVVEREQKLRQTGALSKN